MSRGRTLVLALLAALAATESARAACFTPRQITSWSPTTPSHLYTPGTPFAPKCSASGGYPSDGMYSCGGTMTYYAVGYFWAWGAGSPIQPGGADHGANPGQGGSTWLQLQYFPYKAFIGGPYGHWQASGTDGCITQTGSAQGADFDECQVVLLSDVNGRSGYFLALSVAPNVNFDFLFHGANGFPPRLELVPVPQPKIEAQVPLGKYKARLTVSLPVGNLVPQNGFHFKCHGNPGEILSGFKLYARPFPKNGTEAFSGESRAVGPMPFRVPNAPPVTPWKLLSGPTPIPVDSQVTVDVPCDETKAVALCATLTFGGPSNLDLPENPDWELTYCSRSTLVFCGQEKKGDLLFYDPEPALGLRKTPPKLR